jgi:hypothetical protein
MSHSMTRDLYLEGLIHVLQKVRAQNEYLVLQNQQLADNNERLHN